MTDAAAGSAVARPAAIHHVRLTVTDIERSKAFYSGVFGAEPAMDFSDQGADPSVREDPERLYGGCIFAIGDQLLGLRPVADGGDRFESTRVGLDHVSFALGSIAELHAAAARLQEMGVEHGGPHDLGKMSSSIVSFQDPDDINLELIAENG